MLVLIDVHVVKKLLLGDEHARIVVVVALDDEKKLVLGVGRDTIVPLGASRQGRELTTAIVEVGLIGELLGRRLVGLGDVLEMLLDHLALVQDFLQQLFDASVLELLRKKNVRKLRNRKQLEPYLRLRLAINNLILVALLIDLQAKLNVVPIVGPVLP